MATFRRRGPSRWEAQVRRVGWPTATRTFPTKADAQAWAAVQESAMHRGDFVDRSVLDSVTVGDLFARYLQDVSPKKKGGDTETYRLNALRLQPLSDLRLTDLNSSVIARWRDARSAMVSGSTVNRDLNLMSHVFNTARVEWGYSFPNPIKEIRRPKESKGRARRLGWAEQKRLLRALRASKNNAGFSVGTRNKWIDPIVRFALRTAMRRGEILALRWVDVHLADAYVRVADSKNGHGRDVPLSSRARRILEGLPRDVSGFVFPVSAASLKKAFERAVERAEIADLHFHDLRHEATTRLAKRLTNVLELSSVTVHRTLSMLKRYYHESATELARKLG